MLDFFLKTVFLDAHWEMLEQLHAVLLVDWILLLSGCWSWVCWWLNLFLFCNVTYRFVGLSEPVLIFTVWWTIGWHLISQAIHIWWLRYYNQGDLSVFQDLSFSWQGSFRFWASCHLKPRLLHYLFIIIHVHKEICSLILLDLKFFMIPLIRRYNWLEYELKQKWKELLLVDSKLIVSQNIQIVVGHVLPMPWENAFLCSLQKFLYLNPVIFPSKHICMRLKRRLFRRCRLLCIFMLVLASNRFPLHLSQAWAMRQKDLCLNDTWTWMVTWLLLAY